jgi:Skp family chaperone for outer membrane proteins
MKMKAVFVALLAVGCAASTGADAATRKGKASAATVNAATLLQQARDAFYSYQPEVAAARLAQIKGAARTEEVEQLATR